MLYQGAMLKAAPVQFPHWLHRSKYTCRLCHVDIGFAMVAGETGITCEDIKSGVYCGACHNGNESFSQDGTTKGRRNCDFCHSAGKDVEFKNDFYEFRAKFKPDRFGNGIDWLAAEKYKRIVLKDYLPNVSIKREALKPPTDLTMFSEDMMVPGIIFSHQKHAAWNGCELCHPEIFGIKLGSDQFHMHDVLEGKYCGVCHGKVAFPPYDCRRCHKNVVF